MHFRKLLIQYVRMMNKKEEKSIQRIVGALVELLRVEEYADISTSEIIAKSCVFRSTFYVHFKKKGDVVEEICDSIFHHVLSSHLDAEVGHDFSNASALDVRHIVVHLMYHVRSQKEILKPVFASSAYSIFQSTLEPNVKSLMKACIAMKEIVSQDVPEDLAIMTATSGFIDCIRYYSFNEKEELSPEEMADYFFHLYSK